MQYYELTVTAYLLKNSYYTETSYQIAKVINKTLLLDKVLSKKHITNDYKNYCFNCLYPLENDKTYKAGRVYIFKIRSLEEYFTLKMKNLLPKTENDFMKIISIQEKIIKKREIYEIYTMTPALVTIENKYWLPKDNLMLLEKSFQGNLEKKYKSFYGKTLKVEKNFIQQIVILNIKVISYSFKNTKLLGNKFKIICNEDPVSQICAFMAEATGLGEKSSSAGLGFCNAQYLK